MKRVLDFLKESKVYFIATSDGDQARVRPFGTIDMFDGRLTIMTKKSKNVSKQIIANPKVEISAMRGEDWIRITCEAHEEKNHKAVESMLKIRPDLSDFYKEDDPDVEVFYLSNGKAVIFSSTPEPVEIEF